MIRRQRYAELFRGHYAIAVVYLINFAGFPPYTLQGSADLNKDAVAPIVLSSIEEPIIIKHFAHIQEKSFTIGAEINPSARSFIPCEPPQRYEF